MQSSVYTWSPNSASSSVSPFPSPSPAPAPSAFFIAVLVMKILSDTAALSVLVLGAAYIAGLGRIGGVSAAVANSGHNVLLFLAFVVAVELGFLAGVWMGKKWGAMGYVLLTTLATLVAIRSSGWPLLMGPLSCDALLALLIVSKWHSFE
jgi:hypothetical protein